MSIPIVNKFARITGKGAVGLPIIQKIKSGSAKKPITTKSRNDNLLKADRFLILKEPKIKNIIPTTVELITRANVSNIIIVSLLTSNPRASVIKDDFNSSEKIVPIRGETWKNSSKLAIQNIVLIFTCKNN